MLCPKCNVEMKVIKHKSIETDECPKCQGIWVDNFEEKEALVMEPEVFTVDDIRNLRNVYKTSGKLEKVKYFKCPKCKELMWRKNYMQFSGIIVDKCKKHGTFFDKGELEKAIEFIKKGGIEYEKFKTAEHERLNAEHKLVREVNRVERDMYRLHHIGRFMSLMGF